MPLKKMCGRQGCSTLVAIGITYCDKHQQEFVLKQKQRHQEFKQQRKDKVEQSFYTSDEWLRKRDYIKGKYSGLCLYSYYVLHQIVVCDVVHHIVELKEQWELRLSEENLIPMSSTVHQEIHKLYKLGQKEETQKLLRRLKERWGSEQRH